MVFMDAPPHLAEFRAPASFAAAHPGFASPNDVLLANHAIEGLSRLGRHPAGPGAENFLVDVDDISDGRQFFSTDERNQRPQSDGGIAPVTLGRNGVPGPALRSTTRRWASTWPCTCSAWSAGISRRAAP